MKKSRISLKEKLSKRELTIGSWIMLAHPSIAEIMVEAGFDWLVIDLEHTVIGIESAQNLIQVISLGGCVPLVRLTCNDPNQIKRVMDSGAHGVIVPLVNTREEAERAVSAVKYPPAGTRGVGLARAQGYGTEFDEYMDWQRRESVVIVQIEHIRAVENLESILTTPGVDGFIVGPYDLSGSLGVPGQFDHPDVKKALERVQEVTRDLDAASGFHVVQPNPEEVSEKIDEGYRFIAFGLDILFLGNSCRAGLSAIRNQQRT
jgi:2-keto-3-deoxy-L-rhamnonate aldolase RhmA